MGYTVDLTEHVNTDSRLHVMYHLDESWKNNVMSRALDMYETDHSIDAEDVIWARDDDGTYYVNYRCKNTPNNEKVVESLPLILINNNIIGSMTLDETDAMAAMLFDSGATTQEIRQVLGIESIDNETVEVCNYETEDEQ